MTDDRSNRAAGSTRDEYTVRPYAPGDAADVRDLLADVWGSDRSEDWVAYKHERNPYLDAPPMVVAEAGGRVVGARPYVQFPVRAGTTDLTAAYLNNAMVHPDHRRRGLFTRMTDRVIAEFEDSSASILLALANELSAPGYRDSGFEAVGSGPDRRVRVPEPGRVVRDRVGAPAGRLAGAAADVAMRGYLSLRRIERPSTAEWRVERRAGLPGDPLADLYEAHQPDTLHTRREPLLYEWLAEDPYWRYETYFAAADGGPEAAVAARRPAGTDDGRVEIVDAVPPTSPVIEASGAALVEAVLADHPEAPQVSATGPVLDERLFPGGVLAPLGFVSTARPPASWLVGSDDTAFVYPVAESAERRLAAEGVELTDPTDWSVTIR